MTRIIQVDKLFSDILNKYFPSLFILENGYGCAWKYSHKYTGINISYYNVDYSNHFKPKICITNDDNYEKFEIIEEINGLEFLYDSTNDGYYLYYHIKLNGKLVVEKYIDDCYDEFNDEIKITNETDAKNQLNQLFIYSFYIFVCLFSYFLFIHILYMYVCLLKKSTSIL